MVKIHVEPDCGNAPKKAFIRDFEIAFPKKSRKTILNSITDDIHWEMVGDKPLNGKAEVEKMIDTMLDGSYKALTIETIITHGDTGSANGTMVFEDGKRYGFSDVFHFSGHGKNAKLKKLQSYVVELE